MNPVLRPVTRLLALSTLGLIFLGGLVTSTDSGLAVPDWPLSYGRLMPPMIGGVLFEHGHRLAAGVVALLTVLTAFLFWKKEPRRSWRNLSYAAVALVLLQAVLGGLTVLLRLPKPVSIAHACLAQTFFCVTVLLALSQGTSPRSNGGLLPRGLYRNALALFGVFYAQLVLGAVLRHTGHGLVLHIGVGLAAAALSCRLAYRLAAFPREAPAARRAGLLLVWGVGLQVALGTGTYLAEGHGLFARGFLPPAALVTSHVALGAALLGLALALAWFCRPVEVERPAEPEAAPGKAADYFALTKPGISFMTGATALAGYVLGSGGRIDWDRLVHTVIGTCLVSAGACALNMLLEIDVDARMQRTEKRPLPSKRLRPGEALFFGALLAVAGVLYLAATVNFLTASLAGLTLSVYLYLYTPLKKITALCTAVGAVAGALPPVMGWSAATGSLGGGAWALFAILFFWQYPHFLALAWIYREDYARAGLYMLPSPDSAPAGGILANSVALLAVSALPWLLGLTGTLYLGTALALGALFFGAGWTFFRERTVSRARRVFFASVLYLPLLLTALVFNRV
jgi:heme o synthase